MGKTARAKRNGTAHDSPYNAPSKAGAGTAIFKMKTDIGQHVLKNPGVAQAIVDKAELKQSDVRCRSFTSLKKAFQLTAYTRSPWKSALAREI